MAKQISKQQNEAVILLHGLARTKLAMQPLARALSADYQVINLGYPSRRHAIERLADIAIEPALAQCADATRVHFVTHSLGGILVREYCRHNKIKNLANVVMLGPPNHGSELVDFFLATAWLRGLFNIINGPVGRQLGTSSSGILEQLGGVDFKLGVIAGTLSFSPLSTRIIGGLNDGKVSLQSTRLEGMSDHLVMPVSHTFMMRNPRVIEQVKYFLQHSRFRKNQDEPTCSK